VEFVRALQARVPNAKLVISTTTTTGMAELHKKLPGMFGKIYYPIDRRKYVDMAIRVLHPSAVILVETEVWPNFVWRAHDSRIPMFLINGRLSQRSYPRYRKLGFLFRQLFSKFTGVGVQTAQYARQFQEIGCRPPAVHVTGNLKFDAARIDTKQSLNVQALLRQAGAPNDALVIVAGSTHAGEEEILADMFLRLRKEFPLLFLVLVPRHFERARDAGRAVGKKLRMVYRSELDSNHRSEPGSADCLLVDTTGELMSFYTSATVAWNSGSVRPKHAKLPGRRPDPGECGRGGASARRGSRREGFPRTAPGCPKTAGNGTSSLGSSAPKPWCNLSHHRHDPPTFGSSGLVYRP
jgi:3-deoxy-D-manno-octulosonic-acid transferase